MTPRALLIYTWVAGLAACLAVIGIAAWYWWQERRNDGIIRGKDAEKILHEIKHGTPNTPDRIRHLREADALFRQNPPAPFCGGLDWTLVDIRPLKEGDRVQWAKLTGTVVAVHPGAGIVEFEDTHGIRRLADLAHVERIERAA